jgi:hypothetical protein
MNDADARKAQLLSQNLKGKQLEQFKKEQGRKHQEQQLIAEYVHRLEAERSEKKKELQLRLSRLKQRKAAVHATPTLVPSLGRADPRSKAVHELASSVDPISVADAPEVTTTTGRRTSAASVSEINSAVLSQRRRDKAHEMAVDAKVQQIHEAFGFRRIFEPFEDWADELENEKGRRVKPLPPLPFASKVLATPDSLPKEVGLTEKTSKTTSHRHLVRRQRLRLMRKVAIQVLKGKQQMVGCLEEESFSPLMVFS